MTDILACCFTEAPAAGGIETETHDRLTVLKAWLRIDQRIARNHDAFINHIRLAGIFR